MRLVDSGQETAGRGWGSRRRKIGWMDERSSYCLLSTVLLGLLMVLPACEHISIDVPQSRAPQPPPVLIQIPPKPPAVAQPPVQPPVQPPAIIQVPEQPPAPPPGGTKNAVRASLVADPPSYVGPLPASIRFRGSISVEKACDLRYAFVRADGSMGPVRSMKFEHPGDADVTMELEVPQAGVGSLTLRILSPVRTESNRALYEVRAGPKVAVQVTLNVDPVAYKGLGPATIRFAGTIQASQACDVQFAFIRSDGTGGERQVLRFDGPGEKAVGESRQLAAATQGWELIRVMAPVAVDSKKAEFTVDILEPVKVEATLQAVPQRSEGEAPATIQFKGEVRASQACDLTCVIAHSDGTATVPQTLHFDRPGALPVTYSRQFKADARGWEKLVVQGQGVAAESGKADFDVKIREALKLQATLLAVPPRYDGEAPAIIQFKGEIRASQACEVKYSFTRSDGSVSPSQTLRFDRPGLAPVEESRQFNADAQGWVKLTVQAQGVSTESGKADFDVKIHEVLKLQATLKAVPAKYDGEAPATVEFNGLIRASQACEVKYVFARSDGTASPPQTARFDRPGALPVGESRQFRGNAQGWERIVIQWPAAAESAKADFDVKIREPLKLQATLRAVPPKFDGEAPAAIQFKGTIQASQACEVKCVFVRSDDVPTPAKTVKFDRAGAKDVDLDVKFMTNASGWVALKVVGPVAAESAKADYEVKIQLPPAPVRIEAGLKAEPATYEGPAPATVVFKAVIKADQPCEVAYALVRSDTGPIAPKSLRFDEAGSKEVDIPMRFTADFAGWGQLRVLLPVAAESPKVPLKVTIKEPEPEAPEIETTLAAEPAQYEGKLPVDIHFRAMIKVSRACEVRYLFERSDRVISPIHALRFAGPGQEVVKETWKVQRELSGWVVMKILDPVKAQSAKAEFEVKRAAP